MVEYKYESQNADIEEFAKLILREKQLAWNDAMRMVIKIMDDCCENSHDMEILKSAISGSIFKDHQIQTTTLKGMTPQ